MKVDIKQERKLSKEMKINNIRKKCYKKKYYKIKTTPIQRDYYFRYFVRYRGKCAFRNLSYL